MTEMLAKRLNRSGGAFKPLYPPFLVTSDSHFGHHNIAGYCGRPEDHEELMIQEWNKMVGPQDTVLHLGDLFYGQGAYQMFRDTIAPRLNGDKYIILGNHDKLKFNYEELGFKVIDPFSIPYKGWEIEFSHYPTEKTDKILPGQKRIRVHGHIHNNGYGNERAKKKKDRGKGRGYKDKSIKPNHINVSVEVTNYAPVEIAPTLDAALKKSKAKQHYRNVGVKRSVARV